MRQVNLPQLRFGGGVKTTLHTNGLPRFEAGQFPNMDVHFALVGMLL
jgi:hypothetical protein